MALGKNMVADEPNKEWRPTVGRGHRMLWWAIVLVGVGGVLLAVVGEIQGYWLAVIWGVYTFAAAGAAVALGWLVLGVALVARIPSRSYWRLRLFGFTYFVCWLVLAGYIFVYRATEKVDHCVLYDFEAKGDITDPVEVRGICHRCLIASPAVYYAFENLGCCGDETSVPYIIWAFRWREDYDDELIRKSGINALEIITNNTVGTTREAWVQWYSANKSKTRLQWWADGFTAEGYPVSPAGDDRSIRSLFAVVGRTRLLGPPEGKEWLAGNAQKMLNLLRKEDVLRVNEAVRKKGTEQERCGLEYYELLARDNIDL